MSQRRDSYIFQDKTVVKEGLGKGKFWLFCDISGWHWYHNMYPKSFEQCLSKRDTDNYVSEVKQQLQQLPWNSEALPKIKNLKGSPHIIAGFAKVKKFEQAPKNARLELQLGNLMDLAKHEQGVILQPLIYDDPTFSGKIDLQRSKLVNWGTPPVELVFHHGCATNDASLKSVAPKEIILEDYAQRMAWITNAAEQFHALMQVKKAYMEGELQTMAGWVDLSDEAEVVRAIEETSDLVLDKAAEAIDEIKRKIKR